MADNNDYEADARYDEGQHATQLQLGLSSTYLLI